MPETGLRVTEEKDDFLDESHSENYLLKFVRRRRGQHFRTDLMIKQLRLKILLSILFLETMTN